MDHHTPPSHDPAPSGPPPAWEAPAHHHHPIHHDPPPGHHDPPGYHDGPDVPPPSYDDATNPLLGGVAAPTYNYGTWQERDDSSAASTDIETSESGLHEWVGRVVIIILFVAIIYGFWSLFESPPDGFNHFPGYGPDHHLV
ncbi:hypothetical protein DPSP01_005117 [Paraphaeosphaeria sporulosa]|uniref:Uncharacterized protein n=1 Tax=Paraphaeosphaeria sporulosa TaxID=1460663 RepID=A0A177BYU1_9PLEO|nr:uncharacterized protein CC84DRAFT_1222707 [Paraphaeosphaeria sporulosa]OAF99697.1 hypothetical protein CC84DRAFT_1222707 [Paraphaeosphaeria sporulosa]